MERDDNLSIEKRITRNEICEWKKQLSLVKLLRQEKNDFTSLGHRDVENWQDEDAIQFQIVK